MVRWAMCEAGLSELLLIEHNVSRCKIKGISTNWVESALNHKAIKTLAAINLTITGGESEGE